MKDIRSLHAIRGYCALWVCFGHYHYLIDMIDIAFIKQIARYGSLGIIIFFILSGFFLAYVYNERFSTIRNIKKNYKKYIIYRFGRIYPLYFVILAAFVIMSYLGWTAKTNVVINREFENPYYFPFYLLLIQCWGFLEGREQYAFNSPSWTLSVDALLYIIFPLIFFFILKIKNVFVNLSIIILVNIFYYVTVKDLGVMINSEGEKQYFLALFKNNPLEIVPVFIAGICIHSLYKQKFLSFLNWNLIIVISIIVFYIMMYNDYRFNIILFITPILVYGLLNISEGFDKYFSNNIIYYIGTIAYSIYLWHIPYAVFVNHFFPLEDLDIWGWHFIPFIGGLFLLSSISYHLIENPCRIWIKKNFTS